MDQYYSQWSEWTWDSNSGRWYQWRRNLYDPNDVQYNFEAPRGAEDFTASFSHMTLGNDDTTDGQGGAYTFAPPASSGGGMAAVGYGGPAVEAYSASVAPEAQPASSLKGTGKKDKSKEKSRDKPKDKHHKKSRSKQPGGEHPDDNRHPPNAEYLSGLDGDPFYSKDASSSLNAQGHPETATQEAPSESFADASGSAQQEGAGEEYHHHESSYYGYPSSHPLPNQTLPDNYTTERGDAPPEYDPAQSSSKSKGKAVAHSEPAAMEAQHAPEEYITAGADAQYAAEEHGTPEDYDTSGGDAPYTYEEDGTSVAGTYATEDYDTGNYGYHTGEASTSYSSYRAAASSSSALEAQYARHPVRGVPYNDDGYDTPRPQDLTTQVAGIGPKIRLSAEYVVESSKRFLPGEVFKVLWCEPHGSGGSKTEKVAFTHNMVERDGKLFYQGFRRFIIVRTYEGHSHCVPILTYGRQACKKNGVKPDKHGIVHQHNKDPRRLKGEPRLGIPPVRVKLYERAEKISVESRINYSKVYSIEHNVRVFFIGSVVKSDFDDIFLPAADSCFLQQPLPSWGVADAPEAP
ncbi:hypothetical protein VTJ49DRAFT_6322 [Mycothermus thermophilus]|uniref:DUF6590 domain-containing protein n=1 Tax=Humicola insolens TaxID=85995 RepID=A0ABR3VKC1_HUMIN